MNAAGSREADAPHGLRLHMLRRVLEMQWGGGASTLLPYRLLRERCPCAQCRQLRRTARTSAAETVSIVAVEPYGPNAVHLTFSDGHARGIFPFEYLRELGEEPRGHGLE